MTEFYNDMTWSESCSASLRKQQIDEVLQNNKSWPLLITGINASDFDGAVIIPAKTPSADLGILPAERGYVSPKWLHEIENKSAAKQNLLIIDGIDTISEHEQLKFSEIIKQRSISGHKFPANTQIILTVKNKESVNKQILAYVIAWTGK